jgi:A/G-specific adenine glycosylase
LRDADIQAALLTWYDTHARDLPWRVAPAALADGQRPDPYAVWLSEIMLQQTTVAAVRDYFHRFTARWPTVQDLAAAEDADVMAEWAGLGYYARARNLLKCARAVAFELGGTFPETEDGLQALPGIGPYTAAAIASIAFDRPAPVLDGNIERVMSRLFAVTDPLPGSKPTLKALAGRLTPDQRPGCHAQALMDLGATICTPKSPACGICPLMQGCEGRRTGIAPDLPAKAPKKAKPVRYGIAYLVRRTDGAFLLETRPPSGLLGSMLGWPCSDWGEGEPAPAPPVSADWSDPRLEVRHTFTHFHLRLSLRLAVVDASTAPERGDFMDKHAFRPDALPTVMRKAFDLSRDLWSDLPSSR